MEYSTAIITLSSLGVVLLIPPLAWHLKTKNTPAIVLISWLQLMDIKAIIDSSIWSGEDFSQKWQGHGWCDIMAKVEIGSNVGVSCAVACIAQNLYKVLKAETIVPNALSWNKLLIDLASCLCIPIFVMIATYLAQENRYSILRFSGCRTILSPTWVTLLVYAIWVLICSLLGLIYALRLLGVFYRRRRDARDILSCTNSGLSISQFARLLIFCFSVILLLFPFSMYPVFIDSLEVLGYHDMPEDNWLGIWNQVQFVNTRKPEYYTWVYVLVSILVFLIFGLGSDALSMYKGIATYLGMGPLLDKWNRHLQNSSNLRIQRLTSQFLNSQGSPYYNDTVIDPSGAKDFNEYTPGHDFSNGSFEIDYRLPFDIKRRERRRRRGITFENMVCDENMIFDILTAGKGGIDFIQSIDISSTTELSFTHESFGFNSRESLDTRCKKEGILNHDKHKKLLQRVNTNEQITD